MAFARRKEYGPQPITGVVLRERCPDCHRPLRVDDGEARIVTYKPGGDIKAKTVERAVTKPGVPFCDGCGSDPGYWHHYVDAEYLAKRAELREQSALGMSDAASLLDVPAGPVAQSSGLDDLPL